jgi:nitrate reductase beta subunit
MTNSTKKPRNIRAQIGMVLNLDKCIGCHTCSVTCKNVWTSRKGVEYAWFNNVETKPGIGFPQQWENQDKWNGGWIRKEDGTLEPRQGGKLKSLRNIFGNPDLPEIDDYYEPFDFDYQHLHTTKESKNPPTARPYSVITGERMEKIEGGPNWEEILGTEFSSRSRDTNFDNIQKDMYGEFENTFMMYLPRLCEHCLNPTCVAACPSGSIYKREEDGIVLIDQDKCRGWRMCVSACPYKKIYYNWETGKSEKCTFCYPRIEAGEPTVCSETCVGRIRYLGVLLYDADRIEEVASCESEQDLYQQQLDIFLDPFDEDVIAEARSAGIPESWLAAAQESPVYKMAIDWKVAFPLHPEFRTLPMVWYVPPLSPIQSAAENDQIGMDGDIPDVRSLRIPVQYLANLLTAGKEEPVVLGLERMLAMRAYMRSLTVDGVVNTKVLDRVGLTQLQVEEMYRYMAIANYEDRFVIPTSHREYAGSTFDAYGEQGGCGFSFGSGCSSGNTDTNLFGGNKKPQRSGGIPIKIPIKVEPVR